MRLTSPRCIDIYLKSMQVTIIDANHVAFRGKGAVKFIVIMNFAEHVEL